MAITASMVKELRESTGAGMMDCKRALSESDGDFTRAIEILREKGISKAAKKSDRIATEGIISLKISDDYKRAVICEINSETDFVAKNDSFIQFVNKSTDLLYNKSFASREDFFSSTIGDTIVSDYISEQIQKIGEKLEIRKFEQFSFNSGDDNLVNGYLHSNGKVGAIVVIKVKDEKANKEIANFCRDVAMHISAMNPLYLDESEISENVLNKESDIAKVQLENEGKSISMIEKILPGKRKKYIEENTLLGQKFIKDDKLNVKQALDKIAKENNTEASFVKFFRFELGDGLDKKEEDFANEVANQLS